MSLKALARLVLERDTARDERRDRVSHEAVAGSQSARQFGRVPAFFQAPLALQTAPVLPIVHGEPGLEQPHAARCGRIQELEGAFLHFCVKCGRFAAFGYDVSLKAGKLGRWYCGEHRPRRDRS